MLFSPQHTTHLSLDIIRDGACLLASPQYSGKLTFPVTEIWSQEVHMSLVGPLPEVSALSLPQTSPAPKPSYHLPFQEVFRY